MSKNMLGLIRRLCREYKKSADKTATDAEKLLKDVHAFTIESEALRERLAREVGGNVASVGPTRTFH